MSISPNVPTPQESYHYEGTTGTPRWIAVVFIVLFLALAGLGYAGYSVQSRMESTVMKTQDQNRLLAAQLDQANSRLADSISAGSASKSYAVSAIAFATRIIAS